MKFVDVDTWSEILLTITRNKTRSFLTAFGVFWGIFMLIVLIGGGRAMREGLSMNFKGFATNSAFMWAQPTSLPYKGLRKGRIWHMSIQDLDYISSRVKGIKLLSPNNQTWGTNTVYKDKQGSFGVKGIYPNFTEIQQQLMAEGRFLNDMDINKHRKICVIGKRVKEKLFENGVDACGKYIQVGGTYFCVVGVVASDDNVNIGGQSAETIIIPFTTFQELYNKGNNVDVVCVLLKPGYKIAEVQPQIAKLLKQKYLISPDDEEALQMFNAEAMFSMVDNLLLGVNILIWLIGLGTLFAGIIGVSNIMMVTVRERTTEIGIRRAIGAQPRDIMQQILAESMVLTLVAGMTGICFAVLVLQVAEVGVNLHTSAYVPFQVPFLTAIIVALVLLSLGLLAGLAPAYRALAIKPIDAIRDE